MPRHDPHMSIQSSHLPSTRSCFADDYRGHTSCISEVERYEKRVPTKNKGKLTPQQQWMDLIQSSIDTGPAHLKQHLHVMAALDNVPRKEKQFRNFTTNSLNLRGKRNSETIVTDIWNHLKGLREMQLAARAAARETESKIAEKEPSGTSSAPLAPVRNEGSGETNTKPGETAAVAANRKSVKRAMKKVLKRAKDNTLSTKLLRKAVQMHLGVPKSDRAKVKELVQLNVTASKKRIFFVDGKRITLKLD